MLRYASCGMMMIAIIIIGADIIITLELRALYGAMRPLRHT